MCNICRFSCLNVRDTGDRLGGGPLGPTQILCDEGACLQSLAIPRSTTKMECPGACVGLVLRGKAVKRGGYACVFFGRGRRSGDLMGGLFIYIPGLAYMPTAFISPFVLMTIRILFSPLLDILDLTSHSVPANTPPVAATPAAEPVKARVATTGADVIPPPASSPYARRPLSMLGEESMSRCVGWWLFRTALQCGGGVDVQVCRLVPI